ncbi:flavin reductase (DIM6/NTAB) family NADH-FMN oxidoreductase RutF [Tamaricihabitans halophyticus]|uniref:Flavin reductase (DIM6/NTAB) family NADH-FMN oxidoreductase RutF n=1 Tax=Tamaricihabitans halophyticus TaxID=1262583 RepID=A0A4R2Q634_9PSEU|nr:flavin reductase family protein [Tamaricihabitans halophyticus]TCP43424.1 flavin reductase (DIM6/NTAB) family NADH-FMN oxidoreductase RutF [Tamaricihabitans halophyticus]
MPNLHRRFDENSLRGAFACFPSGVVAVCALVDSAPIGLAASSFVPTSLDPALVSLSIARTSTTWPVLRKLPGIGLSVLADEHGEQCRALAARSNDRFAGIEWTAADTGALFIDNAALHIECALEREYPAGDHWIALLTVRAVGAAPDTEPLVFHGSGFRALAS